MPRSFQLCLLSLVLSVLCWSQSNSGSLAGSVTDPNGAAVPDATVKVLHQPSGREYTTNTSGSGQYVFPTLEVGPITLTVEKIGFSRLEQAGLVIQIANRSVLDVSLRVGDVTQSVNITDEPPLLQAVTSEMGTNFQPKFMQDGPLFVSGGQRNPQNFVSFMPGVNNGFQEGSIAGSSRRSQEVLIDGASAVDTESGGVAGFGQFGSVEQFGEFRLLTNTFSAEYGRTGGGIQIFTTRSGSNEFHGSAFDFIRNDFFDAAGWGTNRQRRFPDGDTRNPRKAKVRQQEWGFNLGGPLTIPKLYNGENRTFFYFTFNGFDQAAGTASGTATLPTARMQQGDFSELPFAIYDPQTVDANGVRQPFPNNRIPEARFSPVSRAILGLIPDPTVAGLTGNFSTFSRTDQTRRIFSVKLDHMFTERNRISGFVSLQRNNTTTEGPLPGVLTTGNITRNKPENYRVNHDFTFTPTLLNHFTFGFTQYQAITDLPDVLRGQNLPGQIGLTGVATGDSASFPNVTFGNGLTGLGTLQNRAGTFNRTLHLADSATWVKGRHELKFGGEIRRQQTLQDPTNEASVQGIFNFQNFQTAGNNTTLRATTGHSFASFLLGDVDNANRTINLPVAGVDARYGHQAFYAQDNFKVTNKLTLNLGLRWDIGLSRQDLNGLQASFNPTGINNAAGGIRGTLIFVGEGDNRIGRSRFGKVYYGDFGPRAGFAYQLDSKTVIRGGYGLFFSPSNGLIGGGCFPCTFGASSSPAYQSNGFTGVFNWSNGFPLPAGFVPPPNFSPDAYNRQNVNYLTEEDGRHARINNWSLNIQRQVGAWLFDVAYIGHYTDRLNARTPLNQVDPKYLSLGTLLQQDINAPAVAAAGFTRPYPSFTGTLAQALRPYPQYLNISQTYSAQGSSRYNGMIAKVERRFSALTLLAGYTFSRAMMYRGADSSNCGCIQPQDAYNLAVERSLHTNDIPHALNVIYSLDMPFGKGQRFFNSSNGFVDRLLSGWTLSGAHQYRSGNLLRVTLPNQLAGQLFNLDYRPNVVLGQSLGTGIARQDLDPDNPNVRWLNSAAFAIPAASTFGNASVYYNGFRNPAFFTENFGLVKRTPITERVNFELRADVQNIFNRTSFGNIATDLSVPANFGRATGVMQGPRIVQVAGRVNF